MKHIILVKHIDRDNDFDRVSDALEDADIQFEIVPDKNSIVLEGRGDVVKKATRILEELGIELI